MVRVFLLVWMLRFLPEDAIAQQKSDLLKRNIAIFLEPFILFRIPIKIHNKGICALSASCQFLFGDSFFGISGTPGILETP